MPLEQRLELDIEDALRGIDRIEEALTGAATSFKVAIAEALDVLQTVAVGEVDASAVTAGIDEAVQAADLAPEVEAEAAGVTTAIDEAVAAADTSAEIDADTSGIAEDITGAIDDADTEVDVSVITDNITDQIEQAVADADATVEVEADTSGAEAAIEDLGNTASAATEGIAGAGVATETLGGLSAASTGSILGLERGLDGLGAKGTIAAAAIAGTALSAGELFRQALDSDTAQRRFNQALGETAEQVGNISVEGFAGDLEELAQNAGSSDEAMKLAAARIADLGRSAGASDEQIAATAENVLLLATRATVLNPTLGDAGDVADRMTNAFARGGRALAPFGIALSSAEINARALADSGKASADELTIFEKAAAGAALVSEQLGGRLREDIVEGAKGTEIQMRSLREEFGNTLEVFGEPLLGPVVESIREGQPILLDLAETFGQLAATSLPLAIDALRAFAPTIGVAADVLQILLSLLRPVIEVIDSIPDPVLAGVAAFFAFRNILGPVVSGVQSLITGLLSGGGLAGAFSSLISPIGLASAALGIAIGVIANYNAKKEEQRRQIQATADAFLDESKAINDDIEEMVRARTEAKNQEDDLRRVGLSVREFGELATQGRQGFIEFLDTLVRTGEITDPVRDALIKTGGDLSTLRSNASQLGVASEDLSDKNLGLVSSFQNVANEAQKGAEAALTKLVNDERLTEATLRQAEANNRNADGTINYVGVLREVAPTSDEAAAAADNLGIELDEQAQAAQEAEDAINGLIDATLSMLNSQVAAEQAGLRLEEQIHKINLAGAAHTQTLRDNGVASKEHQDAAAELRDELNAGRDAALNVAAAQLRLAEDTAQAEGRTLTAAERQRVLIGALEGVAATLAPNHPLRASILGYIQELQSVPPTVNTTVNVNLSQARAEMQAFNAEMERLGRNIRQVSAGVEPEFVSNGVRLRQHGGPVGPGAFLVGDPGPNTELLVLAPGSRGFVFPASSPQTREAIGTGSGGGINVQVYEVANDPEATAFAVAARLGHKATR